MSAWSALANPEIDQDDDLNVDWRAGEHAGREAPLSECLDRLTIETIVQRAHDTDADRRAVAGDDNVERYSALNPSLERVSCIPRRRLHQKARRCHTAANCVSAAACSSAAARSDPRSVTRPD